MPLGSSYLRALTALCVVLVGACSIGEPMVIVPPDDRVPITSTFADSVLQISAGDDLIACTEGGSIPLCGQDPQPGACADNPALGMNDGVFFDLGPLDRIDLGLLCSYLVETGVFDDGTGTPRASFDFRIWGRVEGGAMPVVEVSQDGSTYVAVNLWPIMATGRTYVENPGFQLEVPEIVQARFVRITETAGVGRIRIDAIEAFPFGGGQ